MILRLFVLCLCSVTTLLAQSNFQLAQNAISTAKEGTMLVVVEKFEKNIAALESQIARESDPEKVAILQEQIAYKQQFSELYEKSAVYAFERFYTFGKYQIVQDNKLKEVRKLLEAQGEDYLMYIHKYTADEFAIMSRDNSNIPKPFPQQFDGILAYMKSFMSDADKDLEMYKQFFGKSIYTLNQKLNYQYNRVGYKYKIKEMKGLKWLEGRWKREDKEVYEQWNIEGESMIGSAYRITKDGREELEKLELFFRDQDLVYKVSGIHPEPMYFDIIKKSKKYFTVENTKNDFPKTITYRMDGKYLKVDLKNEEQSETLNFLWHTN